MINKVYPVRAGLLALLLLTLCGALIVPAPAAAQGGPPGWSRVAGVGDNVTLEDVFMVGPELAWVAGRSSDDRVGHIYRMQYLEGRWWVNEEFSTGAGVYAIAATSAEDVWAVGANGQLLRRDSAGWWTETLPVADGTFVDLQVLGRGEEVWAVGSRPAGEVSQPVVLRGRGGAWREVSVELPEGGGQQVIQALHINGGGAWAVGSLIWRIDEAGLRVETTPNLCGGSFACASGFSAVRAIDADRAFVAGGRLGNCRVCLPKIALGYREAGVWGDALGPDGWRSVLPPVPAEADSNYLSDLYLTDARNGLAVGTRSVSGGEGATSEIFALHYVNGVWSYEQVLAEASNTPKRVFLADGGRGLLVGSRGLIMSYGYGRQEWPASNPAARVPNPSQPGVAYFPETGHTLRGAFRSYWERNGGLEQFGYPITEEYSGGVGAEGGTVVQYFERARFEYHPEHAGTRYEVLLGLLGNEIAAGRRGEAPFVSSPSPSDQPGGVYFPETGHTMAAEFVSYWNRYGGLPIYGYPISEAFYEVNQADGRTYLVQYFERNRMEYHPENAGTRYEVLLGLLGNEIVRSRGWTQ